MYGLLGGVSERISDASAVATTPTISKVFTWYASYPKQDKRTGPLPPPNLHANHIQQDGHSAGESPDRCSSDEIDPRLIYNQYGEIPDANVRFPFNATIAHIWPNGSHTVVSQQPRLYDLQPRGIYTLPSSPVREVAIRSGPRLGYSCPVTDTGQALGQAFEQYPAALFTAEETNSRFDASDTPERYTPPQSNSSISSCNRPNGINHFYAHGNHQAIVSPNTTTSGSEDLRFGSLSHPLSMASVAGISPTGQMMRAEYVNEIDAPVSASSNPNRQGKKPPKLHQCDVCSKWFPRPSALKVHMNQHTNSRPFGCTFPGCSQRFTVASNAKRHLRTHGIIPTPTRSPRPSSYVVGFEKPTVLVHRENAMHKGKHSSLYWVQNQAGARTSR